MSQPSQSPPPINPYDSPEAVRPGMSSGAKVLIGLGIGCGVLVLLCCGVGGVSIFFFTRSVQHAVSEDPATIRQVAENIVTIDVPESLAPKMSIDYTIPIVNRHMVSMAVFADRDAHSNLAVFQLDKDFGGNEEMMKTQFDQSIREAGKEQMKEIDVKDSETFKTEINGSPCEFTVGKGKHESSDHEVWQANGAFTGKGGPALLFMQLNAADFSKDQVMDILKSMK